MLGHISRRGLFVGVMMLPCTHLLLVLTALGATETFGGSPGEASLSEQVALDTRQADPSTSKSAPSAVEQAFVGTQQCFTCHRPQTNTWSESNHAQAFTRLPEMYRNDVACLKCHVTAYGQPNGFAAGTEKDLLMVGCEACHGPGALHIDAAKRFVLATSDEAQIEKEMRDTIVKTPSDSVCIGCHTTQAHGRHPVYENVLPVPSAIGGVAEHGRSNSVSRSTVTSTHAVLYSPGYNIKTCGSCHYDQYLHWRVEKHAALSANVPAKYRDDQSCQACHPGTHTSSTSAQSASSSLSRIGVACESCHGASLEHVRFNVQFIHGPRLGPKLEQAARQTIRKNRPATTCIQCHLEQNHKQHPPFEKE